VTWTGPGLFTRPRCATCTSSYTKNAISDPSHDPAGPAVADARAPLVPLAPVRLAVGLRTGWNVVGCAFARSFLKENAVFGRVSGLLIQKYKL
jgi:hypothetical protein